MCNTCPSGAKEMNRLMKMGLPPGEAAQKAVAWLMETTLESLGVVKTAIKIDAPIAH